MFTSFVFPTTYFGSTYFANGISGSAFPSTYFSPVYFADGTWIPTTRKIHAYSQVATVRRFMQARRRGGGGRRR